MAGSGVFCVVTGGGPGQPSGGVGVVGGGTNTSGGGGATGVSGGGGGVTTGGTSPPLTPVGGGGGGKNARAVGVTHIAIKTPASAIPRKRRMEIGFIEGPSSVGSGRRGGQGERRTTGGLRPDSRDSCGVWGSVAPLASYG